MNVISSNAYCSTKKNWSFQAKVRNAWCAGLHNRLQGGTFTLYKTERRWLCNVDWT